MKTLILVLALFGAASALDSSLDAFWNAFKKTHQKTYLSSGDELHRRTVWESNLRYIRQHNLEAQLGKHTYTLKMNQHGDLVKFIILNKKDLFFRHLNYFY